MRTVTSGGANKVTRATPRGLIVLLCNATVPDGWVLCDGTNGTPDLRDRVIVGDTAVGTGTAAGSISPAANLTHSGMSVAAHAAHFVGQATDHDNHSVGQATGHDNHSVGSPTAHPTHAAGGAHTHDAHGTAAATDAGGANINAFTHNSQGSHTHSGAHSHSGQALNPHDSHTGGALNGHTGHSAGALTGHSAHTVTQPSAHPPPRYYLLAYVMWTGVH